MNSHYSNLQSPHHSAEQALRIREQEVNALKVQNRHLLQKLEEAQVASKPNAIHSQKIAEQVQEYIKPVIAELQKTNTLNQQQFERAISQAFEMIQSTLRGVYQQTQRSQKAVDDMVSYSKEIEIKAHESRKADQIFFQDKIYGAITAFCDRVERQIEARMSGLSSLEVVATKQNETLRDLETLKGQVNAIQKNSEASRSEVGRMEEQTNEAIQKMIEVQIQSRSQEELGRDLIQMLGAHRAEFKILRAEMKAVLDQVGRLSNRVQEMTQQSVIQNGQSTYSPIEATSNDSGIEPSNEPRSTSSNHEAGIEPQNVLIAGQNESVEDLTLVLDLIKAKKEDLKRVAKEAENYLKTKPITVIPSDESHFDIHNQNDSTQTET